MKTLDEFNGSPDWETQSRRTSETSRNDSSITLYLREIGRVKLLTPREEIELAARVKEGDEEARNEMIQANLRLVVKIAQAYEGIGVPLPDLISEGNIGLTRAVERFDPDKGAKLSYYSAFWIKQAITKALASQSKAVRLPVHVADKLSIMGRAALRLEEELGREPTDEELAAEMGTSSFRVNRMRMAAMRPASLDAQIEGEALRSYAETVADETAESPYQKLEGKSLAAMLGKMIKTLGRRERAILRSRFGLDGEPPKNLAETGEELGLSGERVRQIEKAALVKLRRRINNLENRTLSPARPRSGTHCKLRFSTAV